MQIPSMPAKKKPHPIPRMIYGPRIFGWFVLLWIFLSVLEKPIPLGLGAWLLLNTLVWPHVAWLLASRPLFTKSPMVAVYRNQYVDSFLYGFWSAAMKFDPWITVLLLSASVMNTLAIGGLKQFWKGTVCFVIGTLVCGLFIDWSFSMNTNPITMALTGGMMIAYSGCISYVAYKQALTNADNRRKMKLASITDSLTGVSNRRYLEQSIQADIERVLEAYNATVPLPASPQPSQIDLGFIMVDMDDFKRINDRYGHSAGDQVLLQVVKVFEDTIRKGDTIVRWGGEEFLIVVRDVAREALEPLAEKIRAAVAGHEFNLGGGVKKYLTCSIGFAPYPFVPREMDELKWERVVDIADDALYAAKQAGKNAWVGVVPPVSAEHVDSESEVKVANLAKSKPSWLRASTLMQREPLRQMARKGAMSPVYST